MARLSNDVVAKREVFLYKLFSEKPDLTAASANEALAKEHGKPMRMKRVYEIRSLAKEKKPLNTKGQKKAPEAATTTAATGAARKGRKVAAKATKGAKAAPKKNGVAKKVGAARKPAPVAQRTPRLLGGEAAVVERAVRELQKLGAKNIALTYDLPKVVRA